MLIKNFVGLFSLVFVLTPLFYTFAIAGNVSAQGQTLEFEKNYTVSRFNSETGRMTLDPLKKLVTKPVTHIEHVGLPGRLEIKIQGEAPEWLSHPTVVNAEGHRVEFNSDGIYKDQGGFQSLGMTLVGSELDYSYDQVTGPNRITHNSQEFYFDTYSGWMSDARALHRANLFKNFIEQNQGQAKLKIKFDQRHPEGKWKKAYLIYDSTSAKYISIPKFVDHLEKAFENENRQYFGVRKILSLLDGFHPARHEPNPAGVAEQVHPRGRDIGPPTYSQATEGLPPYEAVPAE